MRLLILFLLAAAAAVAQSVPGNFDVSGRLNAAQALMTAPARLVTQLPATCTVGEAALLTTAPPREWLHVCTSPNTWTRQTLVILSWSAIADKPVTYAPSVHSHLAVDLPATVVYTTGSYSDPAWISSLAGSKITGPVAAANALAQDGSDCPTGQASRGIDTQGNATGCFVPDGGGGEVGTVTSVGLATPAQFSVLGSPITTSGILTMDWLPQNANTVLAGPASGPPAAPTVRALVAQDLPGTVLHSTGSYANPAWLTSLAGEKIGGTVAAAESLVGANQINFGFGGNPSTVIPNTTFNNIWRAHAHNAWVNEIACWTDTGTVSLTIRRSDGNLLNATPLTCSTSGASTTALANQSVYIGTGLGFTTASASSVKNLSVSIKVNRWN